MSTKGNELIELDRQKFLAAVKPLVSEHELVIYAEVLDRLIDWSRTQSDMIQHYPRSGKQDVVRFRLIGTKVPRILWAAYPREKERDAKLMAVEDYNSDVLDGIRDR